jgi:hypothetical protein
MIGAMATLGKQSVGCGGDGHCHSVKCASPMEKLANNIDIFGEKCNFAKSLLGQARW